MIINHPFNELLYFNVTWCNSFDIYMSVIPCIVSSYFKPHSTQMCCLLLITMMGFQRNKTKKCQAKWSFTDIPYYNVWWAGEMEYTVKLMTSTSCLCPLQFFQLWLRRSPQLHMAAWKGAVIQQQGTFWLAELLIWPPPPPVAWMALRCTALSVICR